jgi:hypothetical protein
MDRYGRPSRKRLEPKDKMPPRIPKKKGFHAKRAAKAPIATKRQPAASAPAKILVRKPATLPAARPAALPATLPAALLATLLPASRPRAVFPVCDAPEAYVAPDHRVRSLKSLDDGMMIVGDVVNLALQVLCAGSQRSCAVSTYWTSAAMPKPHHKAVFQVAPDQELVFIPVNFDYHYVLFVADRSNNVLEVYDSLPEYGRRTRDSIAKKLLDHREACGLPEIAQIKLIPSERQAPGSNDCGLFVIRNMAKRMGLDNWQLTRDDLKVMMRHQWGM